MNRIVLYSIRTQSHSISNAISNAGYPETPTFSRKRLYIEKPGSFFYPHGSAIPTSAGRHPKRGVQTRPDTRKGAHRARKNAHRMYRHPSHSHPASLRAPRHFRRKLQPSVRRALPPVGWHSTCEQPAHTTTVCAWLNTVVIVKQPGHLTSMKNERGPGTSVLSLCLRASDAADGFRRSTARTCVGFVLARRC